MKDRNRDIYITENLKIRLLDEKYGEHLHLRMVDGPYGGHGESDNLTKAQAADLRSHLDAFIGDKGVEERSEAGDERVVLEAVLREMHKQDELKEAGRFKYHCADPELSPFEKLGVLVEEVGEVARALLEKGELANDKHGANLRKELIQVAAVACKWVLGLDREKASIVRKSK